MAMVRLESEMKDSGVEWIGKIPKAWECIKLKYLYCHSNAGEVIDRGYWNVGNELLYTCQKTPMASNYSIFPDSKRTTKNDLLLTRNATPYIFIPIPHSIYSNVVQRITINPYVEKRFVRYGLESGVLAEQAYGNTIPSWNMQLWNSIKIPMPSLEEQYAVANYLDDRCGKIDEIIKEAEESIEEYKALKQAVIFEVVTKGLDKDVPMKDSGVEWIPRIPVNWEVRRIASIYEESKETGRDDLPILLVSIHTGISDREIGDDERDRKVVRSEDKSVYKVVHKNYLVYNMMRAWQGGFGAAIVDGLVSPAYVVAKPIIDVNSSYIEYILRTPNAIEHIRGLSYGVADFRLRLYWPYFKNIKVPIPSLEEQNRIVEHIRTKTTQMDTLISEKQVLIHDLWAYKKSLIYEVVTGKRRIA